MERILKKKPPRFKPFLFGNSFNKYPTPIAITLLSIKPTGIRQKYYI